MTEDDMAEVIANCLEAARVLALILKRVTPCIDFAFYPGGSERFHQEVIDSTALSVIAATSALNLTFKGAIE